MTSQSPTDIPAISIIVIGDELLDGYTDDENGRYLAERLRALGFRLDCIMLIRDGVAAVARAVSHELGRGLPRIVFTIGGVGSTPDDETYAGVAAALERQLTPEPGMHARVRGIVQELVEQGFALKDTDRAYLLTMADVPEGARVVGEGWTSVVLIDVAGGTRSGGAVVSILPGYPPHMKALVDEVVIPGISEWWKPTTDSSLAEIHHSLPENALAGILARAKAAFRDVEIGSYPGPRSVIRIVGPSSTATGEAKSFIRSEMMRLDRRT